jgi:hypothetical protein
MSSNASEEQVLYANILNTGMLIGLGSLVVTFILYATGVITPMIPLEKIQEYWVLPVSEYLRLSNMHAGWAWLGNLKFGDMLNFLPIAFLSLLTIICYLVILPSTIRKKDYIYGALIVIEVLILGLAASGIFGSGGH